MMIVSVILYLSCVILSLASSVVSPLERNFVQNQPAIYQQSQIPRGQEEMTPQEDELVRQLESLHKITQNKTNKPSKEIAEQKEKIEDEVAELRSLRDSHIKKIKFNGQLVKKFQRQRSFESAKRAIKYWNVPHVAPRMNNTLLIMPRVLRKHFRYGWHKGPGSRHYPFNHGAISNTIHKLHQNYLIRNDIEQARAHQIGISPSLLKSFYMPYPLTQQKNETTYPILSTEFSEEMKRQLRDGKVLLLSDSVVRSNFTS